MTTKPINQEFLLFAWETLTTQQRYRINVKYELHERLKSVNPKLGAKRELYRELACDFGYTPSRIEKIANSKPIR